MGYLFGQYRRLAGQFQVLKCPVIICLHQFLLLGDYKEFWLLYLCFNYLCREVLQDHGYIGLLLASEPKLVAMAWYGSFFSKCTLSTVAVYEYCSHGLTANELTFILFLPGVLCTTYACRYE